MSEEKTLRIRTGVDVSVKGVLTWSCTIEGTGYSQEEVLIESDKLVAALKKRYPIESSNG